MSDENKDIVTTTFNEPDVVTTPLESKLLTLKELTEMVLKDDNQSHLQDNVRRFKLSLARKSMIDAYTLIEASELVQKELINQIRDNITIYPITTILDIYSDINKIVDRNLSLMESILPKSDSLEAFIAATNRQMNIQQNTFNMNSVSPATLERISQLISYVELEMKKAAKEDNDKNVVNIDLSNQNDSEGSSGSSKE